MAKATHFGECQLCGRAQKLPNGTLSLHGYTVRGGYFSGVCHGAKHLPFEQSTNLIQDAVSRAKTHRASLQEQIFTLTQCTPKNAMTWVRTYVKNLYGSGRSGYINERVELSCTLHDADASGYRRVEYRYTDANGHVRGGYCDGFHGVAAYEQEHPTSASLLLATVIKYNTDYANTVLARELRQLNAYIAWQEERIATWQPRELRPVSVKMTDEHAFDPEMIK